MCFFGLFGLKNLYTNRNLFIGNTVLPSVLDYLVFYIKNQKEVYDTHLMESLWKSSVTVVNVCMHVQWVRTPAIGNGWIPMDHGFNRMFRLVYDLVGQCGLTFNYSNALTCIETNQLARKTRIKKSLKNVLWLKEIIYFF